MMGHALAQGAIVMVEVEHCLDEVVAAVLLARVHRMADLGN